MPNWHTAPYFGYVMAAYEWHVRPSELGLCRPEEDLAVMLTYVDTRARMQAYEQRQAEKKNGRK